MVRFVETYRWLCVGCSQEGSGEIPVACSECGETASWYLSSGFNGDPRLMAQIMIDQLMGNHECNTEPSEGL